MCFGVDGVVVYNELDKCETVSFCEYIVLDVVARRITRRWIVFKNDLNECAGCCGVMWLCLVNRMRERVDCVHYVVERE